MNYQEKKKRVISKLEDSGYDSIEEWADSILNAIGEVDSEDAKAMDIIHRAAGKLERGSPALSEQEKYQGSVLEHWD